MPDQKFGRRGVRADSSNSESALKTPGRDKPAISHLKLIAAALLLVGVTLGVAASGSAVADGARIICFGLGALLLWRDWRASKS